MTTRPWMPLWIADYRADTAHLSTAEHGAYLLLIMHYWQTGSLPQDDAQLARIVSMTAAEWRKARSTIAAFFADGWKHKRIEEELAEATLKYERRAAAGKRGGKASAERKQSSSNAPSNAPASLNQSQSPSEAKASGVPPPDPKAGYFQRGREVLGRNAGGLLAKLLKSYGNEDDPNSIAKARARIEEASTKSDPSEWLGRVIAGPARISTPSGELFPDGQI